MNRSARCIFTRYALVLVLLPLFVLAQEYVEDVAGGGKVDWTQHVIRATGIGAPNPNLPMAAQRASALRVAKQDALRNVLETVKGIKLDSRTTVENAMLVSDRITTRVEGKLRGYKVVDKRYMSSGDVEVDVEVPLTGIVMDALLPKNFGGGMLMTGGRLLCPVCGQPWPEGKDVPEGVTLIRAGETGDGPSDSQLYSGLIVDAKGLDIQPAMAPRIVSEEGEEVYGTKYVSRKYAIDIGMAGYGKSINRARMNARVSDNPLIVKAVDASGPNQTDLVVSSADAVRIHNAASNMDFLKHCKVLIVLD